MLAQTLCFSGKFIFWVTNAKFFFLILFIQFDYKKLKAKVVKIFLAQLKGQRNRYEFVKWLCQIISPLLLLLQLFTSVFQTFHYPFLPLPRLSFYILKKEFEFASFFF